MTTIKKENRRDYLTILGLVWMGLAATSCGKSAAEAEEEAAMSQQDVVNDNGSSTSTGLILLASSSVIQPGASVTLNASGGTPPYVYSKISGSGTLSQKTYTASSQTETAVLQVKDSVGATNFAYVEVKSFLELKVSKTTIKVGEFATLSGAGGAAPYTFSHLAGVGSIVGTIFSAGSTPGEAFIQMTDKNGETVELTIKVKSTSPLSVSPQSASVRVNQTLKLTASGGTPPYKFDIYEGLGAVDANTGLFKAESGVGQTRVRVTDAEGTLFYVNLTTIQSQLAEDCVKTKPVGTGGSTAAYGQMGKVNGQDVCILPVASRFEGAWLVQNESDIQCPDGFYPLQKNGVSYTITFGQYFDGKYTGAHSAMAATARECVEVCTRRNFWGTCKATEFKCSVATRIACYK